MCLCYFNTEPSIKIISREREPWRRRRLIAIATVQKEGYTVISIEAVDEKKNILDIEIEFFSSVSTREVVILSRQISTLFEAQVSALRVFRLWRQKRKISYCAESSLRWLKTCSQVVLSLGHSQRTLTFSHRFTSTWSARVKSQEVR